ncbi:hypothetical protein G7046_g308 [Stylonectria norvegica]|nr:hypothetical protein G7046_g308 [Stylonectria norvegica]
MVFSSRSYPSFITVFSTFLLFVEIKVAANPFAPAHTLIDRNLFGCCLAKLFGVVGQIAVISFMPLFFQAVQGKGTTQREALLVPNLLDHGDWLCGATPLGDAVDTFDTAVVIACLYLFRCLGFSTGLRTSSAVLQKVPRAQLAARLLAGDEAQDIEEELRKSLEHIKELPPHLADM